MPTRQRKTPAAKPKEPGNGDRFWIDGREIALTKHDKDFVLMGASPKLEGLRRSEPTGPLLDPPVKLGRNLWRYSTLGGNDLEVAMSTAREDAASFHVYRNASVPDEEIVFHGDLQIKLKSEDEAELNRLAENYSLVYRGTMGGSHVFGVTKATGVNCIKAANQIRREESVAEASPLALQNLQMFAPAAPVLFPRQWHLDASLRTSMDLLPDAGIDAPLAWQVTQGTPSIVIAVIDDGFDLTHPALREATLAPGIRDFVGGDSDPVPEGGDYHGTPVAGLIVGRGAIRGVAPGCAFLPVRIGFGPSAAQIDMVQVFRYVSARADAVNCSFGLAPSNTGLPQSFRNEIAQLASSGGRRGRGLVMVFAAGNDDSPTFLPASQNVRGIRFVSGNSVATIPAGVEVHSGYPEIPGVVVAAAMSSRKRKSGFSNWGPQITVAAPSNNSHQLSSLPSFQANYRGLGLVSSSNRVGHGDPFSPLADDPFTQEVREDQYTERFGGTSGAAPIVTGVCGLILSANPNLTATQVRQILMTTADTNLDPTLDLAADPNVQGKTGEFVNGRSLWFGAGKVNANHAVRRAQALAGPMSVPTPANPTEVVEAGSLLPARSMALPQRTASLTGISPGGRVEIAQAIADVSQLVTVTLSPLSVTPADLFDREFQDDLVGIDDEFLMRAFKANLSRRLPMIRRLIQENIPNNPALGIELVADFVRASLRTV